MKKAFLTGAILLVLSSSFQLIGQTDKKNVFKVNFLSPVARSFSGFYEREIFESGSLQLGLFYTGFSIEDTKLRGFGITPEFRFYPGSKGAPQGFFLAPYLRYQSFDLTVDNNDGEATYSSFGGGLLIGGQWIFGDLISLDVWGGPAYNSGNLEVKTGTGEDFETELFDGFGFRFGATVGIAF